MAFLRPRTNGIRAVAVQEKETLNKFIKNLLTFVYILEQEKRAMAV